MTNDTLLRLHEGEVRPEWIDFNGHMNLAYYVLAFDHATDRFLHHIGLGEKYFRQENRSVFVLETHVVYKQELKLGDRMRFTTQLLGFDAKRIHGIRGSDRLVVQGRANLRRAKEEKAAASLRGGADNASSVSHHA